MPERRMTRLLALLLLTESIVASAADEKPAPEPPRIAMCSPLAVLPGTTTKVVIRGWQLDKATAVRSDNKSVTVKILSKGSAAIPNKQDAKQIGDQQVEIEIVLAGEVAPGRVMLTVVTEAGESQPHALLIGGEFPIVLDKEANDGFRQAQTIQVPQIIDGQIHGDANVDVFAFDVADETQLLIEVEARRLGSGLDSILTVYDKRGSIVAVNDDHSEAADSRLDVKLAAGKYFISLQDAHDHGGAAHPYRLVVQSVK